jgi:hypothetical protein
LEKAVSNIELWQEIQDLNNLLSRAITELKERGKNYAYAYRYYRMLLAKELLQLKADGMPATLAYDIARGKEEVAKAKEQEIITESLYESCKEAINAYKLQIRILDEQYKREWGASKNE